MKNTNETGRSMVEMLGVLAIIGVLTVGAMSTVNYGIESFRVRSAYDLVEETAKGVVDLYSWKRSYRDDDDDGKNRTAMKTKVCKNIFNECKNGPSEKCEDGADASCKTAWGKLIVTPGADDAEFAMSLTDVPFASCSQLLNMEWTNVTLTTSSCNQNGNTTLNFTAY